MEMISFVLVASCASVVLTKILGTDVNVAMRSVWSFLKSVFTTLTRAAKAGLQKRSAIRAKARDEAVTAEIRDLLAWKAETRDWSVYDVPTYLRRGKEEVIW